MLFRRDLAFAQMMVGALTERGFEAFLNKTDIAPGDPRQERLSGLIASADTVVFCLSPDSAASQICSWQSKVTGIENCGNSRPAGENGLPLNISNLNAGVVEIARPRVIDCQAISRTVRSEFVFSVWPPERYEATLLFVRATPDGVGIPKDMPCLEILGKIRDSSCRRRS